MNFKPIMLAILDGWGLAPPGPGNAVALAQTPNMDKFWTGYPHTKLKASGKAVGLPEGEMGNSECGHLTLGAGRIVYQDFSRISLSISSGSFFKNKAFISACQYVKAHYSNLHLLGIFGYGSVHADRNHLYALLRLAKNQGLKSEQVQLDIFTDGRDSPSKSAISLLSELKEVITQIGVGEISSICGRYFAMDRDKRWQRTKKSYEALTSGIGEKAKLAKETIEKYYQQNITDEFIPPTIFNKKHIKEGDAIIFYNFRTDRARQLTKAFVDPDFYGFKRKKFLKNIFFVSMTEFEKGLPVSAVAFSPRKIDFALPRVLAERNLRQLHIAETEKYAFVTYYFNGLYENPVFEEDRILIPSPRIATYDLQPEMSAYKITDVILEKVKLDIYDFILVNFANPDMVGHTGKIKAGIKACETVDKCLGKIVDLILAKNGICFVVADHGNVEEMIDLKTGKISTKHSLNPVPFIAIGKKWQGRIEVLPTGSLADVAPTILKAMNIPKPECMTGRNLI